MFFLFTGKDNKNLDKNNVNQSQADPIKSELINFEEKKGTENKGQKIIKISNQNFNDENSLRLNRENAFVKKL